MLLKFNLTKEIRKNLNSWEIFVAETYNKIYSEIFEEIKNTTSKKIKTAEQNWVSERSQFCEELR